MSFQNLTCNATQMGRGTSKPPAIERVALGGEGHEGDKMSTQYFEIRSGRPAGEIYDRCCVYANTPEEAEAAQAKLTAEVDSGGGANVGPVHGNWLYGPHISESATIPTAWDGYSEVPAPPASTLA